MKKLVLTSISALTLTMLAAASSLHAQSLLNGSFESPELPAGDIDPQSPANWIRSGEAFLVSNGGFLGNTTYGAQYVYFNTQSALDQTVSGFDAGSTYSFSVAAADIYGFSGDVLTLSVRGAANASQSFVLPRNGNVGGTLPLLTYKLDFTPTMSGAVTFVIYCADSTSFAVDNAQLSVPEPSTWAMLGAGAVGAGFVGLRRRVTA